MMNTANKRASAIGIGLALRLVLPIPDSTIDGSDRQQVAYSYAGVAAASPVTLDLCESTAVNLTPMRLVRSNRPTREVEPLGPVRRVIPECL